MASSIDRALQRVDDTHPRIVALYDAVQQRDFKQAIQLSRHVEIATMPLAIALSALSMTYVNRRADALNQVQRLVKSGQANNIKILSIVAEVYSRYGMYVDKKQLYVEAVKRNPDSVEMLVELFFCHVHSEDYSQQKLIAMKLFKKGHTTFGTWAATVSERALASARACVCVRVCVRACVRASVWAAGDVLLLVTWLVARCSCEVRFCGWVGLYHGECGYFLTSITHALHGPPPHHPQQEDTSEHISKTAAEQQAAAKAQLETERARRAQSAAGRREEEQKAEQRKLDAAVLRSVAAAERRRANVGGANSNADNSHSESESNAVAQNNNVSAAAQWALSLIHI